MYDIKPHLTSVELYSVHQVIASTVFFLEASATEGGVYAEQKVFTFLESLYDGLVRVVEASFLLFSFWLRINVTAFQLFLFSGYCLFWDRMVNWQSSHFSMVLITVNADVRCLVAAFSASVC